MGKNDVKTQAMRVEKVTSVPDGDWVKLNNKMVDNFVKQIYGVQDFHTTIKDTGIVKMMTASVLFYLDTNEGNTIKVSQDNRAYIEAFLLSFMYSN